ncbi:MAG: hypothetical protein ABJ218_13935 [Winogradskyella arenosi]
MLKHATNHTQTRYQQAEKIMCQFNFLVTKEKSNNSEIKEIASDYGLNYAEYKLDLPNSAEFRTFLTTTKHCDCGSVIGKKFSEPDWKKEKKKLERKRFSKRRIELLLEQKRIEFSKNNSSELETEKWTDFLTDKRLKSKLKEIGIFYRQFSGDLQNEHIKIENEKTNSSENIDDDFLKNIKENELNWIKL